jgi:pSer/pThr/pTyr-binding forkhead associated (FHA) protein
MDIKICPSCKNNNPSENFFCTLCGSKLSDNTKELAKLSVLYGEPNGALFQLRQGRTTIGHDCGNIIVIGDEHISNKHAAIVYKEDVYWIEDRDSKNGVYINGKRITGESELTDGSIIRMGSTIFRFDQK